MRFSRFVIAFSVTAALFPITARGAGPTENDYDLRKAFLIANACEITYLDDAKALSTIKEMGIEIFSSADSTSSGGTEDTHVFMATSDNYTLICFRGTQSAKNWATNFSIQRAPLDYVYSRFFVESKKTGHAHAGFLRAWHDVKPKVIDYLAKQGAPPDDPDGSRQKYCHDVLLGGHSLGGAVALLAGIELLNLRYNVIGIFTFGGPRAVSDDFREIYDEYKSQFPKIHRYVYKDDLVPELPSNFAHLGDEKYSSEMGTMSDSVRSWWRWLTSATAKLSGVSDHSMSNYVETLNTVITENSDDETTRAMAAWLTNRSKPLVSYLGAGIEQREATVTVTGFTDSRVNRSCQ